MNGSQNGGKANAALLLNAKYHPEAESRELAGMEAVADCARLGDLASLLSLLGDKENPPTHAVMEAGKKAIVPTASRRSQLDGNDDASFAALKDDSLPNPLRREVGSMLLARYGADEAGLMRLCTCAGSPFDVRESAGDALLKAAEDGPKFALLFELTTNADVPYPVRKSAGFRLIELSVEHGNYPILLRMEPGSIPTDVNLELEGKADAAAEKAVREASAAKDSYMLISISESRGLAERTRKRAFDAAAALDKAAPLPLDGLPEGEKAKELMGRLARSRLPLKSEPPPSLRPGKPNR